jgi:hypothetical protein
MMVWKRLRSYVAYLDYRINDAIRIFNNISTESQIIFHSIA